MDEKRFSFSGRVSCIHVLSTITTVFSFDEVRQAIDELELSLQPSGWALKEPCDGCEEEKKKRRKRKPSLLELDSGQDADNVTAAGATEADDA